MKFYKYLCWTIKKLDSSYFLDRLGSLVIFDPENWRAHGVRSVCNDFSILFSSKLVGMKQDNRFFLGVFVKMKLKPRTVLATNDHSSCCLCVISSEFLYFSLAHMDFPVSCLVCHFTWTAFTWAALHLKYSVITFMSRNYPVFLSPAQDGLKAG